MTGAGKNGDNKATHGIGLWKVSFSLVEPACFRKIKVSVMGRMSVVGVAALVTVAVTLKAFADPVFAKPVGDNFAFYEDEACTIAVDAPETGIADCVVLFADDAEY